MLNEIKSKYILYIIFDTIKNRSKMNIIKYNKILLRKLNITKDEFKAYQSLKDFNKIFNTSIKDIDVEEIDLSNKNLEIEKLIYFNFMEFKQLKKLLLNNNNLSDISVLETVKFE